MGVQRQIAEKEAQHPQELIGWPGNSISNSPHSRSHLPDLTNGEALSAESIWNQTPRVETNQ